VSLCRPYNGIGVVVNNDRDVLMAFFITGLVNDDIYEMFQPFGTLWLNVVQCPVDIPADGFPVDAHILRHHAAGQINCKPSNCKVKVPGKAASRISPGNISSYDTMFWAINTMGISHYLNQSPAPIKGSPTTGFFNWLIVVFTTLKAKGAIVFMPCVRTGIDSDLIYSISIGIKIVSCNNCLLDIE